eukprot:80899-Chlamydomonas_euryale.AAC.2
MCVLRALYRVTIIPPLPETQRACWRGTRCGRLGRHEVWKAGEARGVEGWGGTAAPFAQRPRPRPH